MLQSNKKKRRLKMTFSPSIQAKMELEKRFNRAIKNRVVPADTKFKVISRTLQGGKTEMYCIDSQRNKIKETGTVEFSMNITDCGV